MRQIFWLQVSSTSELAFTLMMSAIRKIIPSVHDVYDGNWDCDKFIGRQLGDLKIGILGMGRLGKIFQIIVMHLVPKRVFMILMYLVMITHTQENMNKLVIFYQN